MASVNKFIGIGNLTRDPQTSYLTNGDAVTNISIACNETWKDKNTGEKQEKVEFIRITFYRKLAEIAGKYLEKGRRVYVEGKLETRSWTDKQGVERKTTEIIANEMKMLGSKSDSAPQQQHGGSNQYAGDSGRGFEGMSDDVPY